MKSPRTASRAGQGSTLWDLLTLEKLMTGSIAHLVYWCGLGVIALGGFSVIGAAVGVALREGQVMGWLLAIPTLVAGLLVIGVMAMLWRSFCELYVVIIRIGEDLNVLRRAAESQGVLPEDVQRPQV
jgi:hypothetical protein